MFMIMKLTTNRYLYLDFIFVHITGKELDDCDRLMMILLLLLSLTD